MPLRAGIAVDVCGVLNGCVYERAFITGEQAITKVALALAGGVPEKMDMIEACFALATAAADGGLVVEKLTAGGIKTLPRHYWEQVLLYRTQLEEGRVGSLSVMMDLEPMLLRVRREDVEQLFPVPTRVSGPDGAATARESQRRGPAAKVLQRVKDALWHDIEAGDFTVAALSGDLKQIGLTQTKLADRYKTDRSTLMRAIGALNNPEQT